MKRVKYVLYALYPDDADDEAIHECTTAAFVQFEDPENGTAPTHIEHAVSIYPLSEYETACDQAQARQGLLGMEAELIAAGMAYGVEQTGGFTMVITVERPGGFFAINRNDQWTAPDGSALYNMGFYPGTSFFDGSADYDDSIDIQTATAAEILADLR